MDVRMPETAGPIRNSIVACLDDFGYKSFTNRRSGDIRFFCKTPDEEYRAQFIISEKEKLLRIYIFMDSFFPAEWKYRVYEAVQRVNDVVVLGNLGIMEEDEIYYRGSIDFRSHQPSALAVENLLNSSAFPLKLWEKSFSFLMKGGATPKICLEAAMLVLDVLEKDASKEAKKLVMQVAHGGKAGAQKIAAPTTFGNIMNSPVRKQDDEVEAGEAVSDFLKLYSELYGSD